MNQTMMQQSSRLTLDAGGAPRRATRGIAAAARGSIRVVAHGVELTAFGAIWLLLPAWPAVAAAITRDGAYLRRYRTTLARVTGHIRAQWRSHSTARMVAQVLTPRALRRHQRVSSRCTHCGRCCLDRACLFVTFDAEGRSRCRIYGGRLWRRLACGRYPSDPRDIALYGCPSFGPVRGPEHRA
jgi:hypothetical protein